LLALVNKVSILSKATVVIFLAFSKMQLFLTRMPLLAARFSGECDYSRHRQPNAGAGSHQHAYA
jgi:hypothetical protein